MVKLFLVLLLFIFSACSINTTQNNISYNIRFNDFISYEKSLEILKKNSFKYNDISKSMKIFNIEIPYSESNKIDSLKSEKYIKYITPDQEMKISSFKAFDVKAEKYIPNDPLFTYQWNVQNSDADSAWLLATGSKNIKVAVIDSGVDTEHPDLKENLLPLIDIWSELGRTDIYTYNGVNIDYKGKDGNGHGTHVTGILGAVLSNNQGIAGIASNIRILPIKASNYQGVTSASTITKAILRAIDEKVQIINISIGGPKSEGTQALKDAVDLAIQKNILFVSATGNESKRSTGLITPVTVPAAYNGVIAVGAIDKQDKVSDYSNGGSEISLVAPGGGATQDKIYSTFPTYKTYLTFTEKISGPYALLSGTSMSCPHVSAAAALILSREPDLTQKQLRVRLLSSTVFLGNKGFNNDTGYGKLNIYQSLIQNTDDKINP
ncbi:MAG: S8 family serine peptidase [Candidatus Sericytochromatia bacterium]